MLNACGYGCRFYGRDFADREFFGQSHGSARQGSYSWARWGDLDAREPRRDGPDIEGRLARKEPTRAGTHDCSPTEDDPSLGERQNWEMVHVARMRVARMNVALIRVAPMRVAPIRVAPMRVAQIQV